MSDTPLANVCPRYHRAVELIGRRWTGAIVRVLLDGSARFCDVRDKVPQLSDRMLSERLKELEAEGIVVRTLEAEGAAHAPRYDLTRKGRDLEAAVAAIAHWAETWLPAPDEVDEPGTTETTLAR